MSQLSLATPLALCASLALALPAAGQVILDYSPTGRDYARVVVDAGVELEFSKHAGNDEVISMGKAIVHDFIALVDYVLPEGEDGCRAPADTTRREMGLYFRNRSRAEIDTILAEPAEDQDWPLCATE